MKLPAAQPLAALAISLAGIVAVPAVASAHGPGPGDGGGAPPVDAAQVHITHGLPLDDQGTVVDVWAGPKGAGPEGAAPLLDDFSFGESDGPYDLAPADYSIYLANPASDERDDVLGADEIIYNQDLTVPADANVSVVASLTDAGTPTLAAFVNDVSETPRLWGRLSVRHAAAAPAVNVTLGLAPYNRWFPGLFSTTVGPAANGQQAELVLPKWRYDVSVSVASSGAPVAGVEDLKLRKDTLTNVYAVGVPGSTFQFVVQKIRL
jgi:hypothetical protein